MRIFLTVRKINVKRTFLWEGRRDFEISLTPKRTDFNLFNSPTGDRVLGDLGNNLVNENIDLFISDIGPILERSLGKI